MTESEVIFTAGVAGGCISLRGKRQSDCSWLFSHKSNESFHEEMLSDEDKEGLVFQKSSHITDSLEKALELLDIKYEWHRFYPVYIHPEFASALLDLVRERCAKDPQKRNNLYDWEYLAAHPYPRTTKSSE